MSYVGPYNVDRLRPFVTRGARLNGLDERTAQRTAETLDRMTLPMQQSANGTMSGPQVIYDAFRTPQMQANAIRSVAQRNRIPWSDSLLRTGIPGMAAPVGRSQHERGRAVDVLEPYVGAFKENMAPEMRQPLPGSDANHFELTRDAPNVGATPSQGGPMVMGYRSRAQDMRNPYMPQQQPMSPYMAQPQENGFGQFVRQTVNSPLFLMGASVLGSDNIGKGLMQGASAANTIANQDASRAHRDMLTRMRMDETNYNRQRQSEADRRNAELFPLRRDLLQAQVTQAQRDPIDAIRARGQVALELDDQKRAAGLAQRTKIADDLGLQGNERKWYVSTGSLPKATTQKFGLNDINKLVEEGNEMNGVASLISSWDDNYGGYGMGGETSMDLARAGVTVRAGKDAAAWWQDYDRRKNIVRNKLFGAALSAGEAAAFERADINPNMPPDLIRKNLKTQADILASAINRKRNAMLAAGYDPNVINQAFPQAAVPGFRQTPNANEPVKVTSPEEARKLPPGTVFVTPDGRRKVVPGG